MIRYDDKLNNEIQRTVRNFGQKYNRLKRAGVELPGIDKPSVRSIKKEFKDRSELKSYLRELQKFGKRGSEEIAFTDRYDKQFTKYEQSIAKSRQTRAIKMAKIKIEQAKAEHRSLRGKEIPQTLMGTDYVDNLIANLEKLTKTEFKKNLSEAQQAKLMRAASAILGTEKFHFAIKNNFITILDKVANACGYQDQAGVQRVADNIMRVSSSSFEKIRHGEELVVALEEEYSRLKDIHDVDERKRWAGNTRLLIDALVQNIDEIISTWQPKAE